jgi:hypothetical protein
VKKETGVTEYSIKDKVVIVDLGETRYYERGGAPESELHLALTAIQQAVADAGLHVAGAAFPAPPC